MKNYYIYLSEFFFFILCIDLYIYVLCVQIWQIEVMAVVEVDYRRMVSLLDPRQHLPAPVALHPTPLLWFPPLSPTAGYQHDTYSWAYA